MRLALYSDLHLKPEVPLELPVLDVDVVVLAGDIARHTNGLDWATRFRQWPRQPVVIYVAGNHEYYDGHLGLLSELSGPDWADRGIRFLERQSFELNGVRFLGCTLWSGFDLYGEERAAAAMQESHRIIADYQRIDTADGRLLAPADTRRMYQAAVAWLEGELAKPWSGKTVVVTHFAPHRACVAPRFEGGVLTPYFASDLSALMARGSIDLWLYGHTHWSVDTVVEGGCRLLSNQRGYASEAAQGTPGFQPGLVISV